MHTPTFLYHMISMFSTMIAEYDNDFALNSLSTPVLEPCYSAKEKRHAIEQYWCKEKSCELQSRDYKGNLISILSHTVYLALDISLFPNTD